MQAEFFYEVKQRYRYWWFWLACGWMMIACVVYFSLASHVPMPQKPHADKVLHALSYFGLMFWWVQLYVSRSMRVGLGIGFVLMGVGMEVLQSVNPLRYFEVGDMLANSAGVLLASIMVTTRADPLLLHIEKRIITALHRGSVSDKPDLDT